MTDRRGFMQGLAAGGLAAILTPGQASAAASAGWVACRTIAAGDQDGLTGIDRSGRPGFALDLPGRGHGFAVHPDGRTAVVFARRPGTFAVAFDVADGRRVAGFSTGQGRHFAGHGQFTPDGRYLIAAENAYEDSRGVLGIYDLADGWKHVAELPAHGIGPHEIALMPDGKTMAVAIGGIHTHPDSERVMLNLETMRPGLALVELAGGRLVEEYPLEGELHRLSLRHLSIDAAGRVACACQWEGDPAAQVPLMAVLEKSGLRLLDDLAPFSPDLSQYVGSTAFDASGRWLGFSCPRANALLFLDSRTWEVAAEIPLTDGCGLAADGSDGGFIASSGLGQLIQVDAAAGSARTLAAEAVTWDNHMTPLRPHRTS